MLFLVVFFVLPPIIAQGDHTVTTAQRLKAENDARSTLIQAFGGLFFLLALYITYRTFRLNAAGQITTRYSQAISHLGHESIDVRLGGIYALERISNDSIVDRETIFDVLAAFIRQHTPWRDLDSPLVVTSDPPGDWGKPFSPSEDVRAALSVIGRHRQLRRYRPLDLSHTDLRGCELINMHFELMAFRAVHFEHSAFYGVYLVDAFLPNAHFEHAAFHNSRLSEAHLKNAHFEDAFFYKTRLDEANLQEATFERARMRSVVLSHAILVSTNLQDADLSRSSLDGAFLNKANLEGANLEGANLDGADLEGANLERANLTGANLRGANLTGANLRGANLEGVAFLPS